MATLLGRKRAARVGLPEAEQTVAASPPRRRRRWLWMLLGFVGLGLLLVALAPTLVANTGLLNLVASRGAELAGVKGQLHIDAARLGWFSAPGLSGVRLDGPDGEPLAQLDGVQLDKTLLGLIRNTQNLGHIRIERPRLALTVRQDGSNLEDALADLLAQPRDLKTPPPVCHVEVIDGEVTLHDVAGKQDWNVTKLNLDFQSTGEAQKPVTLKITGQTPDESGGDFSLEAEADPAALAAGGKLEFKARGFPLALTQAFLRRAAPDCQLAGQLDSSLAYRWQPDEKSTRHSLTGTVQVAGLQAAGPWLGDDALRLARLELPCQIALLGDRLVIEKLDLISDMGEFTCQGEIPDVQPWRTAKSANEFGRALAAARGKVDGKLDLAQLARLLPGTLRIREGVEIESGLVSLAASSESHADGPRWNATLDASRLAAIQDGRRLEWPQPLAVSLVAHQTPDGPVVDQLRCDAEFLQLNGRGSPDDFHLTADHDLARLAEQLGRFIDLGEMRLEGSGAAHLNWRRDPQGKFIGDGEFSVNNLHVSGLGDSPWTEKRLLIAADAEGMVEGLRATQVDKAEFRVVSAQDRLSARLTQPLSSIDQKTIWPVELQAQGDVGRWLARLRPWLGSMPVWNLAGDVELVADAACQPDRVDVRSLTVAVRQLHAWGPGLYIDEPTAHLVAAGVWSRADQQAQFRELKVTTSALAVAANDAQISWPEAGFAVAGAATLKADLEQLHRWTQDPSQPPTSRVTGTCQGRASADLKGNATHANLDLTIANFSAQSADGSEWTEPEIKCLVDATYDRKADNLALAVCRVDCDAIQLDTNGEIGQMLAERNLQLSGQITYDLDKVQVLLRPYVGDSVQLAGRETRNFSLSGPLAVAAPAGEPPRALVEQLKGQAELGWQSATVYGFALGKGQIETRLADGRLKVSPLTVDVSQGTLHLAPEIVLSPGPMEMSLPPGLLLEQVVITPEMCNAGLMYVAPILAGVTQAQGKFSVSMQGCRVPLDNVEAADAAGVMTVHTVVVGPGALAQEFVPILQGLAQALTRSNKPLKPLSTVSLTKESQVEFRMTQGRVYHRGLELVFPDVTVRTHGSVGMDKTLAVMAEMPIPDKWIGNNPLGEALSGRVIKLPIGGTLDQPRVDAREMDKLVGQLLRDATEGVLRNEVNKQLNKLLKPLGK